MFEYFFRYPDKIIDPFFSHFMLTLQTLGYSLLLSSFFCLILVPFKKISHGALVFFSILYCIPSLSLFAFMIPFTGLGRKTAVFVLVCYNQFFLLRSFLSGIWNVDEKIVEAAKGMGMSASQVLWKIQIPLAVPMMLAGIRMAVLSTVGMGVIAASIHAGGLGQLLFEGMRTHHTIKILWGVFLSVLLNFFFGSILSVLERKLRKWLHLPFKKKSVKSI